MSPPPEPPSPGSTACTTRAVNISPTGWHAACSMASDEIARGERMREPAKVDVATRNAVAVFDSFAQADAPLAALRQSGLAIHARLRLHHQHGADWPTADGVRRSRGQWSGQVLPLQASEILPELVREGLPGLFGQEAASDAVQ